MASVAFIGLGNMGLLMALNLVKAGHTVIGFDVSAANLDGLRQGGGLSADSAADAAGQADIVVTMLPAGQHVRQVYIGEGGIGEGGVIAAAKPGALLIDCSTIDVDSARAVNKAAGDAGFEMLDAPVSGGVGGAAAGTLTFMVGGTDEAFTRA